jgi:pyrimidine-specific ribonucleoside hydrolase
MQRKNLFQCNLVKESLFSKLNERTFYQGFIQTDFLMNYFCILKDQIMKKIINIILLLILGVQLLAHPWKPAHYVIIDTDGGVDDLKAINLFLASPDVRVLAITVSPGALSAENTYIKVKSLLNACFHQGLQVGINRKSRFSSPNFPTALKSKWGDENGINPSSAPDASELIRRVLAFEKTKISFVCLGGMNTVLNAENEIPEFRKQVQEIIWGADGLTDTKGFNYVIDADASGKILNGELPVRIITSAGTDVFYNSVLLKKLGAINTIYAKKISGFLNSETGPGHEFSLLGVDEMVPVYLHYPALFHTSIGGKNSESVPDNIPAIREKALVILEGETVARNQVVKVFPADTSFYFADLQKDVSQIIEKFGIDEWTSGIIANELHRHLGVYAIIGVKMGLRAREYYATGVDEFKATTFAGSNPPLSCMNDGVQVSTGATPGHGLLTVSSDTLTRPCGEFSYMNHRLRLTLKPEIAAKINAELKEINFVYGLDSNIYWELVRKNSIKYWRDLDRHEIFVIEEIK